MEAAVRALLGSGNGIIKTARTLGIGNSTVERIRDEIANLAR